MNHSVGLERGFQGMLSYALSAEISPAKICVVRLIPQQTVSTNKCTVVKIYTACVRNSKNRTVPTVHIETSDF
jgi:hypothetical protein